MKTLLFDCPKLKERFPDGLRVPGKSAAEAIAMLEFHPEFQPQYGERMMFSCPDFQSRDALKEPTDREVIHMKRVHQERPGMGGSGGKIGGYIMIVIGVILIIFAPYLAPVIGASIGQVAAVGFMLALQGLVAVIAPAPAANGLGGSGEGDKSNYLPASKNTVKTGTRIALILGRVQVYGHFLSFQVTATNLNDPSDQAFHEIQGALEATANSDYDMNFADWT